MGGRQFMRLLKFHWRNMRYRRPQRVIFGVVVIMLAVALQVVAYLGVRGESARTYLAILAPFPLVVYFSVIFFVRPFLDIATTGIVVRNMVTLYRIPYGRVTDCVGSRSISLEVKDHGRVPVLAYDTSLTGKRQCERLAEVISENARSVHPVENYEDFFKARIAGIAEILGPGLTILLCLLALFL